MTKKHFKSDNFSMECFLLETSGNTASADVAACCYIVSLETKLFTKQLTTKSMEIYPPTHPCTNAGSLCRTKCTLRYAGLSAQMQLYFVCVNMLLSLNCNATILKITLIQKLTAREQD